VGEQPAHPQLGTPFGAAGPAVDDVHPGAVGGGVAEPVGGDGDHHRLVGAVGHDRARPDVRQGRPDDGAWRDGQRSGRHGIAAAGDEGHRAGPTGGVLRQLEDRAVALGDGVLGDRPDGADADQRHRGADRGTPDRHGDRVGGLRPARHRQAQLHRTGDEHAQIGV
jgi:hypothetical protein